MAWAKLSKLKPRLVRFLDVLRQIYADAPFLKALKKAPVYFKFLRELLSKKGEPEGIPVVPVGEVCGSVLQSQSSLKLQNPGSFSIPCCIGDVLIERSVCDLGAIVNVMPLSLYKKMELLDLKPTTTMIHLADRTLR